MQIQPVHLLICALKFSLISGLSFGQIKKPIDDPNVLLNRKWKDVKNDLLGKKYDSYLITRTSFQFDDSLIINYLFWLPQPKENNKEYFYAFFNFQGNVFRIVKIEFEEYLDELISSEVKQINYASELQSHFNAYFEKKYGAKPPYDSIPKSYWDLMRSFAIASGAGGQPSSLGEKYLRIKDKAFSSDQIKSLLLSFDKNTQFLGLMLFDAKKHCEISELFLEMALKKDHTHFSFGCEPFTEEPTISEIRKMLHWRY